MTIQKIDELKQALAEGTVQNLENMMAAHVDLKGALNRFMTEIVDVYDPLQDKWQLWCQNNLTAGEKAYIKGKYTAAKALYDSMVD